MTTTMVPNYLIIKKQLAHWFHVCGSYDDPIERSTAMKKQLFESTKLGALTLPNRMIMAPMTRSRFTQPDDVPRPRARLSSKASETTRARCRALVDAC
jgi:hypothetical protein